MTITPRGLFRQAMPVVLLLVLAAPLIAAAPAGKTYFVLMVGFDAPYSWEADCLRFTRSGFCASDGACGTWEYTETNGGQRGVAIEMSIPDDDGTILVDGRGRIDDRGPKDSLAAVMRVRVDGVTFNAALSGRSVKRKKCNRLLRDFANDPASRTPACYARADFGDPLESDYVLPFPPGTAYRVMTTYCTRGGHPHSIAYDFDMPVGADVVAARAGEVVMVWEDTPDEPDESRPNGFYIQHDDGTVGSYAHITRNGVLVEEGERIEQGQVVAIGGTSGTSEPHLHFMVYQRYPTRVEDDDVPVNFRNADGPLDKRGGLMWDYVYRALPD